MTILVKIIYDHNHFHKICIIIVKIILTALTITNDYCSNNSHHDPFFILLGIRDERVVDKRTFSVHFLSKQVISDTISSQFLHSLLDIYGAPDVPPLSIQGKQEKRRYSESNGNSNQDHCPTCFYFIRLVNPCIQVKTPEPHFWHQWMNTNKVSYLYETVTLEWD